MFVPPLIFAGANDFGYRFMTSLSEQPRSICWDLELDESVHSHKIDGLMDQQPTAKCTTLNDVHEVSFQLLQGRRDSNLSKIS